MGKKSISGSVLTLVAISVFVIFVIGIKIQRNEEFDTRCEQELGGHVEKAGRFKNKTRFCVGPNNELLEVQ